MSAEAGLSRWLDASGARLIDHAREFARKHSQRYFRGPHLLLAALDDGLLTSGLASTGGTVEDVRPWLLGVVKRTSPSYAVLDSDPSLSALTIEALAEIARRRGRPLSAGAILELVLRDD